MCQFTKKPRYRLNDGRLFAGTSLQGSGKIEFTCAGETFVCAAGTLVQVPAGTVHAFRYGPGGGEMLEITGKRSKAVQMFTALNDRVLPGSPDLSKVVQVLDEHGVKVHA